jgi:hypothetical protein
MMSRVNKRLTAVANVRGEKIADDDLQWYGSPIPPDDGLSTVEVNDVDIDIPDDAIVCLLNEVNPLDISENFGIDLFQRGLELMQDNEI